MRMSLSMSSIALGLIELTLFLETILLLTETVEKALIKRFYLVELSFKSMWL